jgi:hypothetical protein
MRHPEQDYSSVVAYCLRETVRSSGLTTGFAIDVTEAKTSSSRSTRTVQSPDVVARSGLSNVNGGAEGRLVLARSILQELHAKYSPWSGRM